MRVLRPMSNPWSEVYKPPLLQPTSPKLRFPYLNHGERFRDYLSSVAFQIKICTKTPTWSTREVKKIWWILSISIFCAYYRFLTRFLSGYLQKVTSVDLVYGMRRIFHVRSANGSRQCILGGIFVCLFEARTENLRQCTLAQLRQVQEVRLKHRTGLQDPGQNTTTTSLCLSNNKYCNLWFNRSKEMLKFYVGLSWDNKSRKVFL